MYRGLNTIGGILQKEFSKYVFLDKFSPGTYDNDFRNVILKFLLQIYISKSSFEILLEWWHKTPLMIS